MINKDIYDIIARILQKHGDKIVEAMKNNLAKPNKSNTGALSDSITLDITENGSTVRMTISMLDYGKFVNDGRKAGTFPNVQAIREWVKSKGIRMKKKPKGLSLDKEIKTLSYLIGRKIKKDGIKPKKFIPTIDIQSIRLEILRELKQYFIVDIKTDIENFKKRQ